jgi:hypothetical protein
LERVNKLNYDFRSVYSGHIEALRNLIPFHLLENEFIKLSGILPDEAVSSIEYNFIKRYNRSDHQPDNKLILIFNELIDGDLSSEPTFYAPLDNGSYEVNLPKGRYGATVLLEESALIPNPNFFINVT